MNPFAWVGVLLLGGAGAVLRFVVDGAVSARVGRPFPYGTLVVNLTGALLLGLVTGLALSKTGSLLVGTAAIGGYTPFSTWMFETQRAGARQPAPGLLSTRLVRPGGGGQPWGAAGGRAGGPRPSGA